MILSIVTLCVFLIIGVFVYYKKSTKYFSFEKYTRHYPNHKDNGVPTHYAHLIHDFVLLLLKYKTQNPSVKRIYVYVSQNYNKKFKQLVETILPFVQLTSNTKYIYEDFHIKRDSKNDLLILNKYSKKITKNTDTKYVLLIKRVVDKTIKDDKNGSISRSIVNYTELESNIQQWCNEHNYTLKSVQLEGLDILEQIHLFKNASVIIAQHGASLANTVWCDKCKLVIEYRTVNHPRRWFEERGYHQFSKDWLIIQHENNHITVDVNDTIQKLNNYIN